MQPAELDQAIRTVNNLLDAETVLTRIDYKLDSIRQNGTDLRCYCPIHKEELIRSLIINTTHRNFRCGYNRCPGSKGGSLFDLYVLSTGMSPEEALREWQTQLGIAPKRQAEAPVEEQPPVEQEAGVQEGTPESSSPAEPESEAPAPPESETEPAPESVSDAALVGSGGLGDIEVQERAAESAPAEETEAEGEPVGESSSLISGLSEAIAGLDEPMGDSGEGSPTSAPVQFEARLAQAEERFEEGHYEEAVAAAKEALMAAVSGEDKARTRLVIGQCYAAEERHTQAQKEFRTGLDSMGLREETDKELRYHLGLVLEARKDYRSALATFKNLLADAGSYRDCDQITQRIEKAISEMPSASDSRVSFV